MIKAQGVIKAQLHGPRGDLNGVLLQDGTIVRLPPPEAQSREAALAVGKTIFVSGGGNESALGKVVAARMIGTSEQDATSMMPRRDGRGPQRGRCAVSSSGGGTGDRAGFGSDDQVVVG